MAGPDTIRSASPDKDTLEHLVINDGEEPAGEVSVSDEAPDERWFLAAANKGEEEDPANVVEDCCCEEASRCLFIGGAPDASTIVSAFAPGKFGSNFSVCPDLVEIESSGEYN